jgi:hypothetical protein
VFLHPVEPCVAGSVQDHDQDAPQRKRR